MIYRLDGSDRTEELLREAAEADAATHRLALYLGTTDAQVRESPAAALLAALAKLPSRQPLRRERDRIIIRAVRVLTRDLPDDSPARAEILDRLTVVSRQAREDYWPTDTWNRSSEGVRGEERDG